MAKTNPGLRSVYIATAIVIVVTALWAAVFVPRLNMQPEAIADGAADSSRIFFKFLLAAAMALVVCLVLSPLRGRAVSGILSGLLYLAAGLLLIHDFMAFDGAVYYLDEYQGFSTVAILMLTCVGANLIAAILAIRAGNKYRRSVVPETGEGPDEKEGSKL